MEHFVLICIIYFFHFILFYYIARFLFCKYREFYISVVLCYTDEKEESEQPVQGRKEKTMSVKGAVMVPPSAAVRYLRWGGEKRKKFRPQWMLITRRPVRLRHGSRIRWLLPLPILLCTRIIFIFRRARAPEEASPGSVRRRQSFRKSMTRNLSGCCLGKRRQETSRRNAGGAG